MNAEDLKRLHRAAFAALVECLAATDLPTPT
jgi:hypothetical protein